MGPGRAQGRGAPPAAVVVAKWSERASERVFWQIMFWPLKQKCKT